MRTTVSRLVEEGRQEGEVRMLLRQLQIKFGALPEPARQRIESADADVLLAWSAQVLTANSLDEVLH